MNDHVLERIRCFILYLLRPMFLTYYYSNYLKVRGHLAAKLDPLNIKVMDKEKADKLILRSMDVDMADSMDTVFQLPATTFIGGKVSKIGALQN